MHLNLHKRHWPSTDFQIEISCVMVANGIIDFIGNPLQVCATWQSPCPKPGTYQSKLLAVGTVKMCLCAAVGTVEDRADLSSRTAGAANLGATEILWLP